MQKLIHLFIVLILALLIVHPVYAAQNYNHTSEFIDLLWYKSNGPETIIKYEGSSGIGHHKKVIRIFMDEEGQLTQVFEADLLDEHYFSGIYPEEHVAFISDIEFLEMNDEGVREILLTMTKVSFEDDRRLEEPVENKDDRFAWGGKIANEEKLGTIHFYWIDGQYALLQGEIPEQIVKKFDYEDQVMAEAMQKGTVIGNKVFW